MQYADSTCDWASGQQCTLMDVNCRWLLNRQIYMICCFTHLPRTITASVIACPKSKKLVFDVCVLATCGERDVVVAEWTDSMNALHDANGIWHLTVLSLLTSSVMQVPFFCHFSLCTEIVQKLSQNRSPCCTEVLPAELACSMCTKIGLYQSRPPLCPEVVMYRSGPTPKNRTVKAGHICVSNTTLVYFHWISSNIIIIAELYDKNDKFKCELSQNYYVAPYSVKADVENNSCVSNSGTPIHSWWW